MRQFPSPTLTLGFEKVQVKPAVIPVMPLWTCPAFLFYRCSARVLQAGDKDLMDEQSQGATSRYGGNRRCLLHSGPGESLESQSCERFHLCFGLDTAGNDHDTVAASQGA
ncbi:hypothetical protein C8R31_10257 [Nitrosospira sp. Nsp2]|nr:hypothetical protein C8R31_10257 [Nitrosospira sp. Nsp2]